MAEVTFWRSAADLCEGPPGAQAQGPSPPGPGGGSRWKIQGGT
jgi:hypothetical protein